MSSSLSEKYVFDNDFIDKRLRSTASSISSQWADLNARKGFLRLRGGASLTSTTNQSILGRPLDNPHLTIVSKVDFKPKNFSQSAGLVSFFDTGYWQYLSITGLDDDRSLQITTCSNYNIVDHHKLKLDATVQDLGLKMSIENEKVLFYFSEIKHQWQKFGPTLKIDREQINENSLIGICCLDHFERKCHADFEYYTYLIHK